MVLVEVCGGQRTLAFELTTAQHHKEMLAIVEYTCSAIALAR